MCEIARLPSIFIICDRSDRHSPSNLSKIRSGIGLSCFGCKLNRDDGLANGSEGQARKLEVLKAEGNPEEGDAADDARGGVSQCDPNADQYEPDEIAETAEHGSTNVALQREFTSVYSFLAKRRRCQLRNVVAGTTPWNPYE